MALQRPPVHPYVRQRQNAGPPSQNSHHQSKHATQSPVADADSSYNTHISTKDLRDSLLRADPFETRSVSEPVLSTAHLGVPTLDLPSDDDRRISDPYASDDGRSSPGYLVHSNNVSDDEHDDDEHDFDDQDSQDASPLITKHSSTWSDRLPGSAYTSHYQRLYKSALEELQNLELHEFIERASKNLNEVQFETVHRSSTYPEYFGKPDILTYCEEWLCAFADHKLPKDLVSTEKPSKLSLTRSRIAIERIYVLLPPETLDRLFSGELAALYRWKNPLKTGKLALFTLALWYYDQLPASFFAFIVYQTMKRKLYPPSPAEVRRQLANRKARSKEAEDLGSDFYAQGQVSQLSKSIAASAGIAAMMGGLAVNPAPNDALLAPDDASSGFRFGRKKRHRGKYGMYKLSREVIDRFGPSMQMVLLDLADFCEKVKNLLLWRRPKATKQSLVLISAWCIYVSVLSGHLQLKLLLLWAWAQFFFVWACQERYPRYRRAMNPLWWLLWNVPNDVDSALEILQERAQTSEMSSSHAASSLLSPERPSHSRRRSSSVLSIASLSGVSSDDVLAEHFAVYRGIPGRLRFTANELAFNAAKGFRTLSSKLLKRKAGGPSPPEKSAVLFKAAMSEISALKKVSGIDIGVFDNQGLLISFVDGRNIHLGAVMRRNEAFAFLLARSGLPPL